jgi:hypothetical protein
MSVQRRQQIHQSLEKAYPIIGELEQRLMVTGNDPLTAAKFRLDLEKLKEQVAEWEKELAELDQPSSNSTNSHQSNARPQSYIPFGRNPLFQPRPGEFEAIEKSLLADNSNPARLGLVGVTGMGGIGKTQLAVELVYRFQEQQKFPAGIFWMLGTGDLLDWQKRLAELADLTSYLPPDDDPNSNEKDTRRARHFCRYISEHSEALLVLDNVEDPVLVTKAIPQLVGSSPKCAILYTSRLQIAPAGVQFHHIDHLPQEAALRLLLKTTRPELLPLALEETQSESEAVAARALCQTVGYLPLALAHLRAVLKKSTSMTLIKLLTVIRERGAKVVEHRDPQEKALFAAFEETWQLVKTEEAKRLFLLAACFPEAAPIPLWLLGLATELGENGDLLEPLGDARYELHDLSLLEELNGEQVRLHPLVREFGLGILAAESDAGQAIRQEASHRLESVFSNLIELERRAFQVGYWQLLAQMRATRDYCQELSANNTQPLSLTVSLWERRLDRESHLLGSSGLWPNELPGLFYQQLYNRMLEDSKNQPIYNCSEPLSLQSTIHNPWMCLQQPVGAEDSTLLRILSGHRDKVTSVVFSTDGKFILSSSTDNTMRLWDTASGRLIQSFEGHCSPVTSVAFSPDGRFILSGSSDNTIRLWETASGRFIQSFEGHSDSVTSVAFSPDGKFILSGSSDNTARLWETISGRFIQSFEGHGKSVTSVAFSPDGKFILSGSDDKILRSWETASGKIMHSFEGHSNSVTSVVFSPDGKFILSGSSDNTIRLWEATAAKLICIFEGHSGKVYSVAFSPDGRFILFGSSDNTMRLWQVSGQEMKIGCCLSLYQVTYGIMAFYWVGQDEMWLADDGGPRHYPYIYRLKLENFD